MDEPRSWWPQTFWMRKSVDPQVFRAEFALRSKDWKIDVELFIPDFPDYVFFALLVPSEDKDKLNSFLVDFCWSRGSGLEMIPRDAAPGEAVYSPQLENQTESVKLGCQGVALKFRQTEEVAWLEILEVQRILAVETIEDSISFLLNLHVPRSKFKVQ